MPPDDQLSAADAACYVAKELAAVTERFVCFMAHDYRLLNDYGLRQVVLEAPASAAEDDIVRASDHFVRAYGNTYKLPFVLSNCSNNYGSHQFPEKLIPLMINNIRLNKPLPVYGKGENVRDWLWVEDHAAAIDLIFHKGKTGETYNIGGFN